MIRDLPPVRLTPRGQTVAAAGRTLTWTLIAFLVGLLLALAFTTGQDARCDRLLDAGDMTGFERHGCPTVQLHGGQAWT